MAATLTSPPAGSDRTTGASSARPQPPAPTSGDLRRLLRAARRRLRANRGLAVAARAAPWAAAAALALAVLGRLVDASWSDPAATVAPTAATALAALAAASRRIALTRAALAADAGLGTGEVFITSLELGDRADVLADRVRQRARAAAAGASARQAVPLVVPWCRLGIAAALAAGAAAAIVATNPQDARRAERAETRRVLDLAATRLRVEAEDLRATTPTDSRDPEAEAAEEARQAADLATAQRLEALARQLAELDDLDDAAALLQRAEADLGASLTAETEARRAAAGGLDRTLAMLPLMGYGNPNDPLTAAEQLDRAARFTTGMRDEELDALARRLAALAETQRLGNPELEAALERAAGAAADHDRAGAQAALAGAAQLQRDALSQVEAANRRAEVAIEVGATADALGRAARARDERRAAAGGQQGGADEGGARLRAGPGQVAPGQGGQGQGGQGDQTGAARPAAAQQPGGQGSGLRPSAGGGTQQGASADQNRGGAAGAQGGTGSGLSDLANAVGTNDADLAFPELEFAEVDEQVDVAQTGTFSPTGTPHSAAGAGETVEVTDVPTADGQASVPLRDALPQYEAQATAALERPDVPAEDRALVRRYFDRLNQG